MERIDFINTDRIRWCLSERRETLSDCASGSGVSMSALNKLMMGEAGLTANQLKNIANYFDRGQLFFLESGPVNEEIVHSKQFRTITNQKPDISPKVKSIIKRAERQREIYLSLRDDLGEDENQFSPPPGIDKRNIDEAAKKTRCWLALGERNNFDSYRKAVESRGILVFRSNGYAGKWKIPTETILGVSLYDPRCPVIIIAKLRSTTSQSFTLMHELGHILLHKDSSIDDQSDFSSPVQRESQANAFAGKVLVPDEFLERVKDRDRPSDVAEYDEWLLEFTSVWGISPEVILRRLKDARRLPAALYEKYRNHQKLLPRLESPGGNRWRHREPTHIFGDGFVRTVLDAMSARQISLVKASSYLDNIKLSDLHQLENFYART